MSKAQLYKEIDKLSMNEKAKEVAKLLMEELDEQAAILYVKNLKDLTKTESKTQNNCQN